MKKKKVLVDLDLSRITYKNAIENY